MLRLRLSMSTPMGQFELILRSKFSILNPAGLGVVVEKAPGLGGDLLV